MNRVFGAVLGAGLLVASPSYVGACEQVLHGLQGQSRHETIANVMRSVDAQSGSARVTILARDDHYQDVLASIPWAIRDHIPIAVTPPDRINPHTMAYLNTRKGSTIVIVGGHVAVQPVVESQLRSMGFKVERLAGATRVETMNRIADRSGMRRGRITGDSIQPDEVLGGAVAGVTPVASSTSHVERIKTLPASVICYRPGDAVAALYKRSHDLTIEATWSGATE